MLKGWLETDHKFLSAAADPGAELKKRGLKFRSTYSAGVYLKNHEGGDYVSNKVNVQISEAKSLNGFLRAWFDANATGPLETHKAEWKRQYQTAKSPGSHHHQIGMRGKATAGERDAAGVPTYETDRRRRARSRPGATSSRASTISRRTRRGPRKRAPPSRSGCSRKRSRRTTPARSSPSAPRDPDAHRAVAAVAPQRVRHGQQPNGPPAVEPSVRRVRPFPVAAGACAPSASTVTIPPSRSGRATASKATSESQVVDDRAREARPPPRGSRRADRARSPRSRERRRSADVATRAAASCPARVWRCRARASRSPARRAGRQAGPTPTEARARCTLSPGSSTSTATSQLMAECLEHLVDVGA